MAHERTSESATEKPGYPKEMITQEAAGTDTADSTSSKNVAEGEVAEPGSVENAQPKTYHSSVFYRHRNRLIYILIYLIFTA
jgi:hypothetical protein